MTRTPLWSKYNRILLISRSGPINKHFGPFTSWRPRRGEPTRSWCRMSILCYADVSIDCRVLPVLFRQIPLQLVPQVRRVITFAIQIFQKLHKLYLWEMDLGVTDALRSCLSLTAIANNDYEASSAASPHFKTLDLDCPFSPSCISAPYAEVETKPLRRLVCPPWLTSVTSSPYFASLKTCYSSILDFQGTDSSINTTCFISRERSTMTADGRR